MNNEEVIGEYEERVFWNYWSRIELSPATLRICGSREREPYEVIIELDKLASSADKCWSHHPHHRFASYIVPISASVLIVSFIAVYPPAYLLSCFSSFVLVPSVIWSERTSKRIEYRYYKYKNAPGCDYAFAVGRIRIQAEEFDGFIELLGEQIKKINSADLFETEDPACPE